MRLNTVALIAAIVLNGLLIAIGRGSLPHIVGVFALVGYLAVPAFVIAAVTFIARPKWQPAKRVSHISLLIAAVASSSLISLPFGSLILKNDIAAAKQYCESLVPALDDYKRVHATYPRDLKVLSGSGEPPRLLRDFPYYSTDGAEFQFAFLDPSAMMDGFEYSSRSKRWTK